RALYAALAIFKEDEPTPRCAVRRLWQSLGSLDAVGVDDLLVDLAARALLEIDDEDGTSGAIILHDLLREFIRAELPDAAAAHQALLDAYSGWGGWHTVPDDGYLYAHLIYHLSGAGATEAIHALFLDDRWLNARVAADGYLYDGYVTDLETAWFEIAEPAALRQIEAGEERFSAYVDLARLALIRTTINSLASNHVLGLVARAVEIALEGWTPDRALSIAKHVSSPISRAHWYARLLKTDRLTPDQRGTALHRGLGAAYNIYEPQYRAARLAALAGFLEGQEREPVVHDMTAALDDVSESRAATFAGVIAVLDEAEGRTAVLDRALREAMGIHHDKSLAESLISLAPLLDADQLLRVLNTLSRITNERYAVRLLESLVSLLPEPLLDAALEKTEALRYPAFRTRAYAALARRLGADDPRRRLCVERARDGLEAEMDWWVAVSAAAAFSTITEGSERERVLEQAMATAESLPNARSRARAFVMLAEALRPTDSYWVSLCVAQAKRLFIEDDTFAELLTALAGKVTAADLRHLAVISAASIQDRRARADVYEAFTPFLSRELLAELLSQAYGVHDERAQVEAVATLARSLPVEAQEEVFARALDAAETIRDPRVRSRAVAPFASSAPESLLPRVVGIALDEMDSAAGLKIVMGLAERLNDALLPSALDIARRISDPGSSVEALTLLSPFLAADEQREVRRRAEAGGERTRRGMVYLALAAARAAASEAERSAHAAEALAQAHGIHSPVLRGWALVDIARVQRNPEVDAAITALYEESLTIRYEWSRASALAALSALLTPAQRARALPVIHAMSDPWARAWALAAFSNLPDSGAEQVAEFRRFIVNYVRLRTDVKRESKLQFLAARLIYRAPTFDRETLAALTRVVIDVCWAWRWL
ncbi:MAG: hypothetical protein JNL42_20295, partial [Anaerolineae bacterium]|nr:hypothetical protein [Anaerolineae bacterium]